ncbi:unnamed protein product [Cuscuta campestris]|uniref:Integrase zinc-binding domain-containing protein n=1 Tax=Cuscuta campestris TaxID=132261 RepID=A0A484LL70_9ASTE|nr:unnamed protein product [Cuscuta campestris]
MMEQRYPHIFATACATHCLDLILEDFSKKMPIIQRTVKTAQSITTYIYNHTLLVDVMKEFTDGRDLVRPGATRFATNFLTLQCLLTQKHALRTMFASPKWYETDFAKTNEGKTCSETIYRQSFWKNVALVMKISLPIVKRLQDPACKKMKISLDDFEDCNEWIDIAAEENEVQNWDVVEEALGLNEPVGRETRASTSNPVVQEVNEDDIEDLTIEDPSDCEIDTGVVSDQTTRLHDVFARSGPYHIGALILDLMASSDVPTSALTLDDIMHAITDIRKDLHATKARVIELATAKVDETADPRRPTFMGWRPPPSRTTSGSADPVPRMRIDAPRFSGDDPTGWIFRIQKYFDYFLTPEPERLQLVAMLIDHPASDWFHYYQSNTYGATWADFLVAVQHRFDPHYYENYVGLLSKLTQTSSVLDYETDFESLLNKVSGVPEATLISMFVAGLKQPVQREVNLRNPTTLQSAFALARELAACHQEAATAFAPPSRRPWSNRPPPSAAAGILPPPSMHARPNSTENRQADRPSPSSLPVVVVSTAEKAERSKKGLCWYCDEKWDRSHNCRRRFLVLMGPDSEDPPLTDDSPADQDDFTPVIFGDVSSIHSMSGSPSPRSLKLAGSVNGASVQVLLDSGSTHNFIHPGVAERLALVLHPVTPFRVYVGNGDSLRCSYSCPRTPVSLQGQLFEIDLFMLEVHGPDIVLGIQWLQTLGKVAHDYAKLTMEFSWNGDTITLRDDSPGPRPVSYNQLSALLATPEPVDLYEVVGTPMEQPQVTAADPQFPADLPDPIRSLLTHHAPVFGTPTGLPPARFWDHWASNRAADALSRRGDDTEVAALFTTYARPLPKLLEAIAAENTTEQELLRLYEAVAARTAHPGFTAHSGILYYQHRLVLASTSFLRHQLLTEYHSSPMARHQGVERTFRRLITTFYWPAMQADVRRFVAACLACQTTKYSTHGQTEVLNRSLEQYLRAFVYGRLPPSLFPTISTRSRVALVEELLRDRAELLTDLKNHLATMRQRMTQQANAHRREVTYAIGDLVLLKLRPYRQHSIARPLSTKLSRRFYGPFPILERVGPVAYRLQLPPGSRIHDVFHVSLLRPFVQTGDTLLPVSLPNDFYKGRPISVPIKVLDARTILVDGLPQDQWLIRWSDGGPEDSTWEPVVDIRRHYPDLGLEDKAVSDPGRVDTGLFLTRPPQQTTRLHDVFARSGPFKPRNAQFFELCEEATQNGLQVTDEEIWYSLVEGHNAKNRVPGVGDDEREMRKMNPSSKPRRSRTSSRSTAEISALKEQNQRLQEQIDSLTSNLSQTIQEEIRKLYGGNLPRRGDDDGTRGTWQIGIC